MPKAPIHFEASAGLQKLLGRELIPNEGMAIVELVKNAYDSGAQTVEITIQPETSKEPAFIQIVDDGSGMSFEDFERLFMVAGYSERPGQVRRARIPTGEKGIGRFAADKLGRLLVVTTAQNDEPTEIRVSIDWKDFDDTSKKFNEVQAQYEDRPRNARGSGTTLEITRLHAKWDDAKIRELREWLSDLLNPFGPPDDFRISLTIVGKPKLSGDIEPLRVEGDIAFDLEITPNGIARRVSVAGSPEIDETDRLDDDATLLRGLRARFQYFNKRPSKKRFYGPYLGCACVSRRFPNTALRFPVIGLARNRGTASKTRRTRPHCADASLRLRRDLAARTQKSTRYDEPASLAGQRRREESRHCSQETTRHTRRRPAPAQGPEMAGEPAPSSGGIRTSALTHARYPFVGPRP